MEVRYGEGARKTAHGRNRRHIKVTADPLAHTAETCMRASEVLARVGDKWSILVIAALGERPYRFNELKRAIDGISQRMLTLTVRGLERDGFIIRTVTPTIPPRVDYDLTDLGRSVLQPARAMGDWAIANRAAVDAARQTYDAARSQDR